MEKMFENLDILECWFNNNIINLDQYLKIKSSIIDFYRPKKEEKNGEIPFRKGVNINEKFKKSY